MRWSAIIKEFTPTFHYKPGKENKVADALSRQIRQFINNLSESIKTAHSEESFTNFKEAIKYPGNQFKKQPKVQKSSFCFLFRLNEIFVIDLINKTDQLETLITEHNRAHCCLHTNFKQIISNYFFPNIKKLLKSIIWNCKICLENKSVKLLSPPY